LRSQVGQAIVPAAAFQAAFRTWTEPAESRLQPGLTAPQKSQRP
jgi:hypothetical protein